MENPFEILEGRLNKFEAILVSINTKLSTPTPVTPPSTEYFIDSKEVSKIFGVSEVSIWDWEKKGLLKAYRIGRLKRFKLNEVMSSPKAIERGISEKTKGSNLR